MSMFLIGAALGIVHVWLWLLARQRQVLQPIPVVLAAAALGAVTYGTILYAFFG